MKKALVVFLALAMVAGVFADEPVADVKVSAFSGEAKVIWGVDLDTMRTGFDNSAKVTFKLNLFNGGDKSTSGDGVWGEIKIKTDSDTFIGWEGNDKIAANKGMESDQKLKVVVDVAKLHLGPAYIGIKSGDTNVGEYKLDTAIRAEQVKNDNVGPKKWDATNSKFVSQDYKYGITAGYAMDGIFSIDVDFRSAKAANDVQYSNAYALAGDVALKMVPNANIKLGGAVDFFGGSIADDKVASKNNGDTLYRTYQTIAGYAAVDYKLAIGEKFYVLPQVGFTHETIKPEEKFYTVDPVTEKDGTISKGNLVAGLLFGWGDKKDANAGVPFLDGDSAKKVVPGVGVTYRNALYTIEHFDYKDPDKKEHWYEKTITGPSYITASVYSGEIVPNLTAAAFYTVGIGDDKTTYKVSDGTAPDSVTKEAYKGYEFALGAKYAIAVGNGKITPSAGFVVADARGAANMKTFATDTDYATNGSLLDKEGKDISDGLFNLKIGCEFGGFVPNTTFNVDYASGNLKANGKTLYGNLPLVDTDDKTIKEIGTVQVSCKISL